MKGIAKTIKQVLCRESYIQFAFLFGSRAKGNVHPLSDYDIAVFIDIKNAPSPAYGLKSHIMGLFAGNLPSQKIQIVILNEASPFLAFEAIDSGHLLFKRDNAVYHNFVFGTYQRYFDMKKLYRLQEEKLLGRIKNGTYGS